MSDHVIILGCGGSFGTPAAGGIWGDCDPAEPKNERTRASIYIEKNNTKVIVDTSYDLRTQMNRHKITDLDGVLFTHAHSDHVAGIDDLRMVCFQHKKILNIYSSAEALEEITHRWSYIFKSRADGLYKQFLNPIEVPYDGKFTVGNMNVETYAQDHMTCTSLGFRVADFAYSVDVVNLSEESLQKLNDLDTWVVDCGAYKRDVVQSHANLARVLSWVERLKPKITYLTDLTVQMDYKTLCHELPAHIRPAYDGLRIDI